MSFVSSPVYLRILKTSYQEVLKPYFWQFLSDQGQSVEWPVDQPDLPYYLSV